MNKVFLLSFLLIGSIKIYAQETYPVDISHTKYYKNYIKGLVPSAFGYIENVGFFSVDFISGPDGSSDIYLSYHCDIESLNKSEINTNDNYCKPKTIEMEFKVGKEDAYYHFMITGKDSLYICGSIQNWENKMYDLYAFGVDSTLTQVSANQKIIASNPVRHGGNFKLSRSPDDAKCLIYSGIPRSRSKKIRLKIDLIDSDLNLIWKLDTVIIREKKFNPMNIAVDNDGNVVLLLRTVPKGVGGKGELFIIKENGKRIINQEFPFEVPNNHDVKIGDNGIFVWYSFVTNRNAPDGGIICTAYDLKNEKLLFSNCIPFNKTDYSWNPDANITTAKYRKTIEKKGIKSSEFKHRGIHISDNGKIWLVSEKNVTTKAIIPIPGVAVISTNVAERFDDIMVRQISNDGKLEKTYLIPKRQAKGNHSIESFIHNNELHIIYNDHIANLNPEEHILKFEPNRASGSTVLLKITDEGYIRKHLLFQWSNEDFFPAPIRSKWLSNGELIMIGGDGKKVSTGLLKFE